MPRKQQIIILTSLILSLCLNIVLLVVVFHKSTDRIVGTYCTGDGLSENDKYTVFQQDSSYVIYRQFEVIEEGKYSAVDIDNANMYSLISENDASENIVSYIQPDGICLIEGDNNVVNFTRISDMPVFINVQKEE